MQGYNGTALCYGQTGAGKSFTVFGSGHDYNQRGLLPRCLARIFREVGNKSEFDYKLTFSCLEIYNESMYDLLASMAGNGRQDLSLAEHGGSVVVKGLSAPEVTSEEEVLRLLFEAEANRAVAQHKLNEHSSRSHVIYMLQVARSNKVDSSGAVIRSKLTMVDLAGSERLKKSSMGSTAGGSAGAKGAAEQLEREARAINKSLSFLEQVVVALGSRSRGHVPHRSCKLTSVLRDSLGGNCKTVLVANIWTDDSQTEETLSTLRFASRMASVSNSAVVNQHVARSHEGEMQRYIDQIADLKRELAMHDQLANRSNVKYEPFSDAARAEVRTQVMAYLEDEQQELQVTSLRHVREIFMQFRSIHLEQEEQLRNCLCRQQGGLLREPSTKHGLQVTSSVGETTVEEHDIYVGEESGNGFGVGVAPNDARPGSAKYTAPAGCGASTLSTSSCRPPISGEAEQGSLGQTARSREASPPMHGVSTEREGGGSDNLSQALAEFKKGPGREIARLLLENKAAQREKRANLRKLGLEVNGAKQQIDELKELLDRKREQRVGADGGATVDANGEEVDVIDEEEFLWLNQLKASKAKYRSAFDQLRDVRSETEYISRVVEDCQEQLRTQFEAWWAAENPEAAAAGGFFTNKMGATSAQTDPLDQDEMYEQVAMDRILQTNPDSVAYLKAAKSASARAGSRADPGLARAKTKPFQ